MDTLDQSLAEQVVRSYGAAVYNDLLDVSSLHRRLPELYEDAAAYPASEMLVTLPWLVELTKQLREHATATRELIVALERAKTGLRGGFDRPPHWRPQLTAEDGWHDDAWDI
jgi:hypothetical protein